MRILAAWLLYGVSFCLTAMDRWGPCLSPIMVGMLRSLPL